MTTSSLPNGDRKLRVLYVAYPLLPVTENSAGGAEQVLWALEREMHARGHATTVAACSGSQIAGKLFATGEPAEALDEFESRSQEQRQRILDWLSAGAASDFDLIHDMSSSFWQHAAGLPLPVLATVHLARSLYKNVDFSWAPECVSFNCVSTTQRQEFRDLPRVVGVAQNGIALDRFPTEPVGAEKREYFLWLGRICEEKGTHTALDVTHAAGAKIIMAGAVYPFLYHQKYFAREIIPRLKRAGKQAKYIEQPTFPEKLELIRNARALLITSEVNESSSMVAMEAAACGTPVIALDRGALREVIAHGVTGFLVCDSKQMVLALSRTHEPNSYTCREYAEKNYSATKMADAYLTLYGTVVKAGARSAFVQRGVGGSGMPG